MSQTVSELALSRPQLTISSAMSGKVSASQFSPSSSSSDIHLQKSSKRPNIRREDTVDLLSYYHSPLADEGSTSAQQPQPIARQLSTDSQGTSSSNYSPESSDSEYSVTDDIPKSQLSRVSTRRTSIPSQGGADRRRLHIVETSSSSHRKPSDSPPSLRSRRGINGHLDGLALVAPPDISKPKNYAKSEDPPATAPLPDTPHQKDDSTTSHTRAASEVTSPSKHRHKKSREVAVVSTEPSPSVPVRPESRNTKKDVLQIPVFQHPQSRSPSPSARSDSSMERPGRSTSKIPSMTRSSTEQSIHTPKIGQEKEIGAPVASPVVVNLNRLTPEGSDSELSSSTPFFSNTPSSFLRYQPGLHSTAGPLPEPPRASFAINPLPTTPPPPRPPRLSRSRSPTKSARSQSATIPDVIEPLQRTDSPQSTSTHESAIHELNHQREGAFPPSRFLPSRSSASSVPPTISPVAEIPLERQLSNSSSRASPKRTSIESPRSSLDRSRSSFDGSSLRHSADLHRPSGRQESQSPSRSPPSSYHGHTYETPSPPAKSIRATLDVVGQGMPSTLTMNDKRFSSLPRTPSGVSSAPTVPSPPHRARLLGSPPSQKPRRPLYKLKSRNPPAMSCADITPKKSTVERCTLYARKINELYLYDCGLNDWIVETKLRSSSSKSGLNVRQDATLGVNNTPRQISRGSMISHATGSTFPNRADATKATDLTPGLTQPADGPAAPAPPVLPYPSLAHTPRSIVTNVSLPSPASSSRPMLSPQTPLSKAGGGFFSSLGRKTSVRRDRPGPVGTNGTTGKLLKSPPPSRGPMTPISSPSVPGGPRAPGSRAQRSQTFMALGSPTSGTQSDVGHGAPDRRASILSRRPSLAVPPSAEPNSVGKADSRVDKLVELLPNADPAVLAAYLRRSGDPMLAIGQYLEDEKQGTIRGG